MNSESPVVVTPPDVTGLVPVAAVLLVGVPATRVPDVSAPLYSPIVSSKYEPAVPAMRIVTLPPVMTGTDQTPFWIGSVTLACDCLSRVIVPSTAVPALIVQSPATNAVAVVIKRPHVMVRRLPAATFAV